MKIVNQSNVTIVVNHFRINPLQKYETSEMWFNTQPIYSDIGAVEITTEYNERSFDCYGKLTAREDLTNRDTNGLPYIIVEYV